MWPIEVTQNISQIFLTKYNTKSIKFNLLFYPDWIQAKNGTLNGSCWTYEKSKIIISCIFNFHGPYKEFGIPLKLRAPVAFSSCEVDSNTSNMFLPPYWVCCCILKPWKVTLHFFDSNTFYVLYNFWFYISKVEIFIFLIDFNRADIFVLKGNELIISNNSYIP